jgi:hypothetical protein
MSSAAAIDKIMSKESYSTTKRMFGQNKSQPFEKIPSQLNGHEIALPNQLWNVLLHAFTQRYLIIFRFEGRGT